jgi:hypothetical protein
MILMRRNSNRTKTNYVLPLYREERPSTRTFRDCPTVRRAIDPPAGGVSAVDDSLARGVAFCPDVGGELVEQVLARDGVPWRFAVVDRRVVPRRASAVRPNSAAGSASWSPSRATTKISPRSSWSV